MKSPIAAALFLATSSIAGLVWTSDVKAQQAQLTTNASFVGSSTERQLVGLPVLTERAVKVGHVIRAPGFQDGSLERLVVDTSSSGRPGLDGKLRFRADTVEIRRHHIFISMSEAERLN